jgi:hypothetical protein
VDVFEAQVKQFLLQERPCMLHLRPAAALEGTHARLGYLTEGRGDVDCAVGGADLAAWLRPISETSSLRRIGTTVPYPKGPTASEGACLLIRESASSLPAENDPAAKHARKDDWDCPRLPLEGNGRRLAGELVKKGQSG